MRTETLKLADIRPYANNPRKNDGAVDAVMESIRQCGYIAPIIVDENFEILAGHTRYKALKKLRRETAECVVREGLTEEQKKKYRILDNKTNELAEWDADLLAIELSELDFGGFDFGFPDAPGSESSEIVEDEPPEVDEAAAPVSKRGDIWKLGSHRLMCGDSTSASDVEKLMNGGNADLLLTDPPYNVDYSGGTKVRQKIAGDNMQDAAFREFLADAFRAADAVMKPGASFYIWHADTEGYNFRGACRDIGWKVRACLVWNKNSAVFGRSDYHWKHEPCLYGWKDGTHLWASDRKQTTVLNFDRPSRSEAHPTMKPVALFAYLQGNNTKEGDLVLDLFAGSGTTLVAAEQIGRVARVMELDPRYCDAIIKRWEALTGGKAVLLNEERQ